MLLPAIFFICWDMFFTSRNVWDFNRDHVSGTFLFNLPIEEVLFFFVVPYCGIFIYECIRSYFPNLKEAPAVALSFKILAGMLFVAGIIFFDRSYTGLTFLFTAVFIATIYLLPVFFKDFHATAFLISYFIILLPFLIVNGLLTSIPVVTYNDAENLGIRIHTIPVEDSIYGMLLMLMNTSIYEKLKNQKR